MTLSLEDSDLLFEGATVPESLKSPTGRIHFSKDNSSHHPNRSDKETAQGKSGACIHGGLDGVYNGTCDTTPAVNVVLARVCRDPGNPTNRFKLRLGQA
jgi:hypothetical protein